MSMGIKSFFPSTILNDVSYHTKKFFASELGKNAGFSEQDRSKALSLQSFSEKYGSTVDVTKILENWLQFASQESIHSPLSFFGMPCGFVGVGINPICPVTWMEAVPDPSSERLQRDVQFILDGRTQNLLKTLVINLPTGMWVHTDEIEQHCCTTMSLNQLALSPLKSMGQFLTELIRAVRCVLRNVLIGTACCEPMGSKKTFSSHKAIRCDQKEEDIHIWHQQVVEALRPIHALRFFTDQPVENESGGGNQNMYVTAWTAPISFYDLSGNTTTASNIEGALKYGHALEGTMKSLRILLRSRSCSSGRISDIPLVPLLFPFSDRYLVGRNRQRAYFQFLSRHRGLSRWTNPRVRNGRGPIPLPWGSRVIASLFWYDFVPILAEMRHRSMSMYQAHNVFSRLLQARIQIQDSKSKDTGCIVAESVKMYLEEVSGANIQVHFLNAVNILQDTCYFATLHVDEDAQQNTHTTSLKSRQHGVLEEAPPLRYNLFSPMLSLPETTISLLRSSKNDDSKITQITMIHEYFLSIFGLRMHQTNEGASQTKKSETVKQSGKKGGKHSTSFPSVNTQQISNSDASNKNFRPTSNGIGLEEDKVTRKVELFTGKSHTPIVTYPSIMHRPEFFQLPPWWLDFIRWIPFHESIKLDLHIQKRIRHKSTITTQLVKEVIHFITSHDATESNQRDPTTSSALKSRNDSACIPQEYRITCWPDSSATGEMLRVQRLPLTWSTWINAAENFTRALYTVVQYYMVGNPDDANDTAHSHSDRVSNLYLRLPHLVRESILLIYGSLHAFLCACGAHVVILERGGTHYRRITSRGFDVTLPDRELLLQWSPLSPV